MNAANGSRKPRVGVIVLNEALIEAGGFHQGRTKAFHVPAPKITMASRLDQSHFVHYKFLLTS